MQRNTGQSTHIVPETLQNPGSPIPRPQGFGAMRREVWTEQRADLRCVTGTVFADRDQGTTVAQTAGL